MQPNNVPESNWGFRSENNQNPAPENGAPYGTETPTIQPQMPQPQNDSATWTASEFLSHHKGTGWYLSVLVVGALLSGIIYLVTKDVVSAAVIFIVFILFAIISAGKPRQLTYIVDRSGITIGPKFYPYTMFKSFAVRQEGAIGSINFVPLKRFMPELTVYYALLDEPKILDVLMNSLPNDQKGERATDRLMKRIRF